MTGIVSGIAPAFIIVGNLLGLVMATLLIGPLPLGALEGARSKPLPLRVALVLGYVFVLDGLVLLLCATA